MSGESASRTAVLDALRARDTAATAADLAGELDLHVNTVRFHLDRLVEDGRVERAALADGSPGRPAFGYRVVRQMDPSGPRRFAELATVLTEDLAGRPDGDRHAAALGRAWGARMVRHEAGVGSLVGLLDALDFAPDTPVVDDSVIRLRHCPFLELAQEHREIVCSIHLGLMQGALQEWGSDLAVERLEAFVEPDLCLAHITRTEESR